MLRSDSSSGVPANFALQGGGAHGAFTWGVLDRVLEDGRVAINAISGTSAGAMNAVVCADGFARGGVAGARQAMADFWRAVSRVGMYSPVRRTLLDRLLGRWSLDFSPGYHFMESLSKTFSPYQLNPLDINPLLAILRAQVDFERVREGQGMDLFISATNVETGKVKVFQREELTAEMVMASACLPTLYQAVEIDGMPYWDGGYMGNPVLFPFYENTDCADIVVVQINPIRRDGAPRAPQEIFNRIDEITFNSSLLKEFRAIEFVSRLVQQGKLDPAHYTEMRVHLIENEAALKPLQASSKLNTEWAFLSYLHELGRETASAWLERHVDAIGKEGTVDLRRMFS